MVAKPPGTVPQSQGRSGSARRLYLAAERYSRHRPTATRLCMSSANGVIWTT